MKIRYKNPPKKILILERRKTDEINKKRRNEINNFKQRGIIMTHLTKEIESTYKTLANHHELRLGSVELAENGDYIFKNTQMRLYSSLTAFETDGKPVDNFISYLTYTVSRAERDAESDIEDDVRAKKALLKKITTSVLNDEGIESNKFHGNVGDIDYIGVSLE